MIITRVKTLRSIMTRGPEYTKVLILDKTRLSSSSFLISIVSGPSESKSIIYRKSSITKVRSNRTDTHTRSASINLLTICNGLYNHRSPQAPNRSGIPLTGATTAKKVSNGSRRWTPWTAASLRIVPTVEHPHPAAMPLIANLSVTDSKPVNH